MATLEEAISVRDALAADAHLNGASAFGVMAAKNGEGWGVKISFERDVPPDFPTEIDGVQIDAEAARKDPQI
jgi:hypothetical protein